jgi:hypothetical protein
MSKQPGCLTSDEIKANELGQAAQIHGEPPKPGEAKGIYFQSWNEKGYWNLPTLCVAVTSWQENLVEPLRLRLRWDGEVIPLNTEIPRV